jgi:hypothetical protein
MYDDNEPTRRKQGFWDKHDSAATALIVTVVIAVILGFIGLGINYAAHGIRNYSRGQRLADERNQVQVNDIQIAQTQQLVKVQQQKAQIKIEEAKGIAEAQRIINSSLTPLYLQHEAIQAQESMANSPNHTTIYIPSGTNGIPLVQTTNQ